MIPQNHDTLLSYIELSVQVREILILTHNVRALVNEPIMDLQAIIIHHIAIYIGLRTTMFIYNYLE